MSSLAAALAEPHPLVVFESVKLDSLRDPMFLHDRLSEYFSSSDAVLKQSLDVFQRLHRLEQRCTRDEWAEERLKQYEKQLKHSAMQPKDPESVLKDLIANPLPLVTDAEVDAFITALTPTQLRTLRRMHAVEKVDDFEYMWDLEEIHDTSVHEKKLTINTYSTHGASVAPPSVTHKSVLGSIGDCKPPRVAITPMDPLFPNSRTIDKNVTENIPNIDTSSTPLAEPACTVEVSYTIGVDTMSSGGDDESTGSFCRFSRMAIARAEKRLLFEDNAEVRDLSKGEATAPMTPKEHFDAQIFVEKPRNGMDQLQGNDISHLPPFSLNLINGDMGSVGQLDGSQSVEKRLSNHEFALAPTETIHTASDFYKGHAQSTHTSARREDRSDIELLSGYVRNILLLNKVRERDELGLRHMIYREAQQEITAVIAQFTPTIEQLLVLLKEVNAILPAFNSLERSALSDHIENPANFLLIPRYTLRCADFTCGTTFSTTVMRIRCGRCGQVYCPQCCRERGLGPDVCLGNQRVSLGWEPICVSCWNVCKARQKIDQERSRQRLITRSVDGDKFRVLFSMSSSICKGNSDPVVLGDNKLNSLQCNSQNTTNRVAEQSPGAFGSHERLEDGFAVFHVIAGVDSHVGLSDSWTYRIAKIRGSLQCLWQSTGILASKIVTNAAHQLKNQHKHRVKQIILPVFQKKGDKVSVSLPTEERGENNVR
ncbi:unnamed protein product [Phytomonas sp. EM1]|nr:unnamed protein product [Phytomonas sp. EM1]|eukprot:CCW60359.1 unnamed protein product [Phytomonas sp. isolate EM1]